MNKLIKNPFERKQKGAAIVLCIVYTFFFPAFSQEKYVWDYPIKPGSEEWRMTSYDEKVEKSQPPKELLKSWDTETLFRYCIDYPFNKVVGMYNNPNDGFKRAYEQSAVWQEFIQRKDVLDILVKYFESRPFNLLVEIEDEIIRNNELFTLYFLEKLVSETDFTLHLDSSDKQKLANAILQLHQSKKGYPDKIFGYPYNSSLVAILKILESDNAASSNDEISLAKFREKTGNESFVDENMESVILLNTVNYINKKP